MSKLTLAFSSLALVALLAAGCDDDDAPKKADAGTLDAAPTGADAAPATDVAATADSGAVVEAGAAEAGGAADGSRADGAPAGDGGSAVDGAPAADGAAMADASALLDGPPGSMAVGPAGGMLMLSAGTLVIPAGALSQTTHLTFRFVNTNFPAIPGNQAPASSVVSLEPHGQTFAVPVTLTLNHFGGGTNVTLYTAQPGGTFTAVPGAVITATTAQASLTHFSYFVVAPNAATPDAGATADTAPDMAAPSVDAGPTTHTVRVLGETMSFNPELVNAKVGDTVTWTWEASGHSVVSGGRGITAADCATDGKFSSGTKNIGESFSFTFTTAGEYGYHCATHCAQFEGGSVVVTP